MFGKREGFVGDRARLHDERAAVLCTNYLRHVNCAHHVEPKVYTSHVRNGTLSLQASISRVG